MKFIKNFKMEDLIWIDERHFEFGNKSRKRGYFKKGKDGYIVKDTSRKECLSLLAAINTEGIVFYDFKYSIDGGVNSKDFIQFYSTFQITQVVKLS